MKILILLSLFYSLSAQESYYNPDLSSTGVILFILRSLTTNQDIIINI